MKGIDIKRFARIVGIVVISFSIVIGILMWILIRIQSPEVSNQSKEGHEAQQNSQQPEQAGQQPSRGVGAVGVPGQTEPQTEVTGDVNTKNINIRVRAQKYTLMSNGSFDPGKINEFMVHNASSLILKAGSMVAVHKLADVDGDGVYEIALMYERTDQSDRYLMVSIVRWRNNEFVKEIDTVFKKNDYVYDTNEVVTGDIIPGGKQEIAFLQKDLTGYKGSRIKIFSPGTEGFTESYMQDTVQELEARDIDGDGIVELYTSVADTNGSKHYFWSRWENNTFKVIQVSDQPMSNY